MIDLPVLHDFGLFGVRIAGILDLSWDEWQIAPSPHIVPGETSIRSGASRRVREH